MRLKGRMSDGMSLTAEPTILRCESFREVVDEHARGLFRLAFRLTGNEADAEEVVQETFMRAYRWRSRFDGRCRVATWLYRIASNASMDLLRRRKRRSSETELDPVNPPPAPASQEQLVSGREIGSRIYEAMDRLSETERTAFVLRHCQGCSVREIAQILGSSEMAAKHAVFRAVRKLREELEPLRGQV
jgi:RNA polymerase sigma-70 factor (ECF subfamily)